MKTKMSLRKPGIVIGLALILSLLMIVNAHAQTDGPIVQLFRLGGNYAGVKITFPDEDITNKKYLVMVSGKGFDCEVTPPNVLYCMGIYRRSSGPSVLHLIDLETKETVLKRSVLPPLPRGFGIKELLPEDYLPVPTP